MRSAPGLVDQDGVLSIALQQVGVGVGEAMRQLGQQHPLGLAARCAQHIARKAQRLLRPDRHPCTCAPLHDRLALRGEVD